jgi:hypothetical protein
MVEAATVGSPTRRNTSGAPTDHCSLAIRVVRFETGKAIDARLARRKGMTASATTSRPVRRASRM